MTSYDWDIYGGRPFEIHHKDCPVPESDPVGDANSVGVEDVDDDDAYETTCSCLDPLLGGDRA